MRVEMCSHRLALALGISALLLAAGCSPLRQASLVYGSKSVAGFSVAVSATSQPDFNVTIGYNNNDFAYVPVVASFELDMLVKACAGTTPAPTTGICAATADQFLKVITGKHEAGDSVTERASDVAPVVTRFEDATRAAKAASEEFEAAKKNVSDVETALGGLRGKASAFTGLRNPDNALALSTELKKLGGGDDPAGKRAATVASQPTTTFTVSDDDVKTLSVEIAAFKKKLRDEASKRSMAAQDRVDNSGKLLEGATTQLVAEIKRNPRLLRNSAQEIDALSVFGRFDARGSTAPGTGSPTTAASPNVGFDFGKVFSTGVASQNLTKGLAESALLEAQALCLKEMAGVFDKLKPEEKTLAATKELFARCEANRLKAKAS